MKKYIVKVLVAILWKLDALWVYECEGQPDIVEVVTKENLKEMKKKYSKAEIGITIHTPILKNLEVKDYL